ncbi:hypothetical protein Tco_0568253 [Tanacetum coccineum]
MSNEPIGKPDSISRSVDTSDLLLEELIAEIGLDDSILTEIDDGYCDSEGDILYLEQLLNEDTSSDLSPALLPKESSLLVPPLPNFKKICLREVERFDPFFSLTQSGDMMGVMEIPFDGFPQIPLPCQVAYSPKVVMYRYFHPHLILSVDLEIRCTERGYLSKGWLSVWYATVVAEPRKIQGADIVMSDLEDSTVTYTAVSSPFEGLSDIGSPGVDGPPMMPEDPYAYVVAAFQAPPSPDYMYGP